MTSFRFLLWRALGPSLIFRNHVKPQQLSYVGTLFGIQIQWVPEQLHNRDFPLGIVKLRLIVAFQHFQRVFLPCFHLFHAVHTSETTLPEFGEGTQAQCRCLDVQIFVDIFCFGWSTGRLRCRFRFRLLRSRFKLRQGRIAFVRTWRTRPWLIKLLATAHIFSF